MFRLVLGAVLLAGATSLAAPPRIDSLAPSQGPIAGGTIVTVRGAGLTGAALRLDGNPLAATPVSDSELRFTTPQHDNGYALIQVSSTGQSSAAEFLYLPPKLQDLPPGYITTVAGVGKYSRVELPATQCMIDPTDVTVAATGDIYFMEVARSLLFRVDAQGILHHVAGTLRPHSFEYVGDGGPAVDAWFGFSRSVAIDAAGNAYITDSRGRIRKVDAATGIVTTVAGTGLIGHTGDGGPATQAQIGHSTHIACAPDGTLYFVEALPVGGGTPRNLHVRKVTPDGIITTIAGNGTIGDSGDGGPAVAAPLNIGLDDYGDVAIDSKRNVFILEYDGQRIRRVDAQTGVITMFVSLALPPRTYQKADAIAVDGQDNVYAATQWYLYKFDPTGRLLDQWGGEVGFSEDGTPARQMKIGHIWGMAVAPNGDVVFAVGSTRRVRKIDAVTQTLKTVAGIAPNAIGVPGDARGAVLASTTSDLAFLPSGDLLYSDYTERQIYQIDVPAGTISAFAGTGTTDYGEYIETPALHASLDISGLDVDERGTVYMADVQTIRSTDPQGIVHRIAGRTAAETNNNNCGFSGDGFPASTALLCQPWDVALDRDGNVFIVDTNNNRIRRVDRKTGIITTVAGSGPSNGLEGYGRGSYCGDGGPAVSACFNTPIALAIRDDGSMFVNDFYNHTIRKVGTDGIVSSLSWPLSMKMIVGPGQSIFGHGLSRIYRADHDEARTLFGGPDGFAGDGGPAAGALMATGESGLAMGLAIDLEGNLFFHDAGNYRIRAVRFGALLAPPGARIETVRGTPQTAALGDRFRTPLEVLVRDADGVPTPSVRVDYACPASGPTCLFANGLRAASSVTDGSGLASVSARPDGSEGSYSVTATPLTASTSASFTLANAPRPSTFVSSFPGAAETEGLDAYFSSTLTLSSLAASPVTVQITFVPSSGATPPPPASRTLAPRQTLVIEHVLKTLFGLESTAGTLVVTSSAPFAGSLTTSNVAALGTLGGVYGLALEPVDPSAVLSAGETGHAIWATQNAAYRTNVAVTLLDPDSAVEVRVIDASGALRGKTRVSGDTPLSWQRSLTTVAGSEPLEPGRVEIEILSGRATGYTVTNDNVTGDAIAAQIERIEPGLVDLLLDGVARAPGQLGTYWSTDVRLFNPGNAPLPVQIDPLGIPQASRPIGVTVPRHGLLELRDVLGLDGFGLQGGVAGAIRLRASSPFLVAARTSNRDPSGTRPGTFSAFQRAVPYPGGLLAAPSVGVLPGVEHTSSVPGFRSNLALLAGAGGATGSLVLRDGQGAELSRQAFALAPSQWTQRSLANWFPGAAIPSGSRVDVEVSSGALHGYLSRVDNATGDAVVVPLARVSPVL